MYNKYIKYKKKYLKLKKLIGGKILNYKDNKKCKITKDLKVNENNINNYDYYKCNPKCVPTSVNIGDTVKLCEKKVKILFMFLGGLPSTKSQLIHWGKFLNTADDSLDIVVHQYQYNQQSIPNVFQKWYDKGKLFFVDSDHHVKTGWGTKSLSDATLLMIQYASIHKKTIYKKYVLLSNTCSPLYNYSKIYEKYNENDKSWFMTFEYNEDLNRYFENPIFCSQWFSLDKNSLHLFFDIEKLLKSEKTYEIIKDQYNNKKEYICYDKYTINKIKSSNNVFQKNLNIFDKKDVLENQTPCIFSDEMFFGNIVINEYLKNLEEHLTINKYNEMIENNKFINKIIQNKITYVEYQKKNGYHFACCKFNDTKNLTNNKILISSTFTDWSKYSIDPFNILRGFIVNGKQINLNLNPDIFNKQYLVTTENIIKGPYFQSHPVEYSTWNLLNMINAFNFIEFNYFNYLFISHDYRYIAKLYLEKINKDNIKDKYYIINNLILINNEDVDYCKNKLYGTYITEEHLNNALNYGALFIRKCKDNSQIDKYSDQLFNI